MTKRNRKRWYAIEETLIAMCLRLCEEMVDKSGYTLCNLRYTGVFVRYRHSARIETSTSGSTRETVRIVRAIKNIF